MTLERPITTEGAPPREADTAPRPYRLVRPRDPHVALARAVELCARHAAFADRPFGHWARVLIGQVNRGQCRFVVRDDAGGPRVVGFAGWFRTGRAAAERWLAGADGADHDPQGDCVVINAVAADDPGVPRALMAQARLLEAPPFTLYAKRVYADGRTRPVRLPVRAAHEISGAP
ncbi:MAG: toxin-activating lysine-acyltransferase [Pseudomonadota bacterium]